MVRYNVVDTATPPKVSKKEAEFFELEEVLTIREALLEQPLKWQAITDLLIDTGARRGEILGLKWNTIDFKNNSINIENNLQYTTDRGIYLETSTKNNENRTVNVAPEIMVIIKAHKFRHTQASLLYAAGENPIVISKRLGHKQVSTTQNIYAHMMKDGDKQASDKIANQLYRKKAVDSE